MTDHGPPDREVLARELVRERAARKAAESLIESKSRELYDRALQLEQEIRTRRAAEGALLEYAEALAEEKKSIDAFLRAASHDLQTPLRTIVSLAQLLARKYGSRGDSRLREDVAEIVRAGRHLGKLIQALLDFVEVGRAQGGMAWITVRHVFEPVQRTTEALCGARGGVLWIADEQAQVWGIPRQLQTLAAELVSNAFKFRRPEHPPRVEVTVAPEPGGVRVSVADNGVGIPADRLEWVFGVFRRLHAPDAFEGSGVGLAVCARIIERHEGRIWAESTEGRGSVFHFWLPEPSGEAAAPAPGTER